MTFSLYGTTFVDGVTVVPAAFLNKLRTEQPSAVDGRGGSYTNTSLLRFTTSGGDFKVDGSGTITLSASTGLEITSPVIGSIPYVSGSVTALLDAGRGYALPAGWLYEAANSTVAPRWVQQAALGVILIPIDAPVGSVITSASALIDGQNAVFPPGNMPIVGVSYRTTGSTTLTSLGTATDSSATQGAYNASHAVTVSGLSETVLSTRRYFVRITGEGGANYAGGDMTDASVTLTITAQPKWYG